MGRLATAVRVAWATAMRPLEVLGTTGARLAASEERQRVCECLPSVGRLGWGCVELPPREYLVCACAGRT